MESGNHSSIKSRALSRWDVDIMWMELVRIIVGLGITNDISGYQLIELLITLYRHFLTNCDHIEVRIKWFFNLNLLFNFQFPSSCIFSRLIKSRFEWILELISRTVYAHIWNPFRKWMHASTQTWGNLLARCDLVWSVYER